MRILLTEPGLLFSVLCPARGHSSHCFRLAGREGVCNLSRQSIPFPVLPKLLLSATGLVHISLAYARHWPSGPSHVNRPHVSPFDSYPLYCLAPVGHANVFASSIPIIPFLLQFRLLIARVLLGAGLPGAANSSSNWQRLSSAACTVSH